MGPGSRLLRSLGQDDAGTLVDAPPPIHVRQKADC
jgi:hypothetical protein